ncbi:MAG: hypothetical protein SOZ00_05120 [Tidjanibacter sp.]|nr:hypothetical protein [Tidjanibacter sp.]
MTLGIVIFGILTGSLLSVLVGLIGARRRIGFGWTFLISVIFTPLVGLIVALVSEPLPQGERRWGCLGAVLALLAIIILAALVLMMFFGIIGSIGGLFDGAAATEAAGTFTSLII